VCRAVRPFTPDAIEHLRSVLEDHRDRTLISVLGYAGPRPEDALALEWPHIRQATILFEQKNVDGEILIGQKVDGTPARTTDMLDALRRDLDEWRLASGRPDTGLVFPRADGSPWRDHDYRNWRRRVWQPACAAAGLGTLTETITYPTIDGRRRRRLVTTWDGPRPYDLRHSFISLMIHEGRLSPIEIASQVGNSAETILRTYAHIFAEMRDQPKVPADEQIATARANARKETAA
jgi:integrase